MPLRRRHPQRDLRPRRNPRPGQAQTPGPVRLSLDGLRRRLHRQLAVGLDQESPARSCRCRRGVATAAAAGLCRTAARRLSSRLQQLPQPAPGVHVRRLVDAGGHLFAQSRPQLVGLHSVSARRTSRAALVPGGVEESGRTCSPGSAHFWGARCCWSVSSISTSAARASGNCAPLHHGDGSKVSRHFLDCASLPCCWVSPACRSDGIGIYEPSGPWNI